MKRQTGLVTSDEYQRQRLKMPKGDLRLGDGRVLRPIIGYDIRQMPWTNAATREGILDSAGWRHLPSNFIVSASVDNTPKWGPILHVSMSYPHHDPSWEEIKWVRSLFFPANIDVMMMLPKASDYVNVHAHCFHLQQCPQEWGLI